MSQGSTDGKVRVSDSTGVPLKAMTGAATPGLPVSDENTRVFMEQVLAELRQINDTLLKLK